MPNPVLYHNPRCSKSRQALSMLNLKGLEFDVLEYLKTPLNKSELTNLYTALSSNHAVNCAHDMLRTKEAEYKLAGLSSSSTDSEIISAIAIYPKLLERPIYVQDELAAIGRPLENIEALIND